MPRATMLAAEEQAVISALNDAGESHKKIAEKLKRSRHVVTSYLSDPQAYGKKKSCGRPRKVNCQDERRICRAASNSTATLRQIRADVELPIFRSTVWRTIRRSGHIHHAVLTKTPWITEEHKRAKLNFAQENMETDWSKVNDLSDFLEAIS
ncbi:hypothetical protein ANCCAN_17265 [Ancylostoma caninum]|uniref:Tc3 transposase DNA binding domain-containing protein n=1 Tax=Ancylostoma caninum TaxID=29170 RepID=A0A368FXD5_ANCCA|nr:hypothetical protein ANCCAN_17265 [Ancylostoma caninum]